MYEWDGDEVEVEQVGKVEREEEEKEENGSSPQERKKYIVHIVHAAVRPPLSPDHTSSGLGMYLEQRNKCTYHLQMYNYSTTK